MSMHGRGMTSSSRAWTVLSSTIRAPPSQARTMFCASCVWGAAEGASGGGAGACPAALPVGVSSGSQAGMEPDRLLTGLRPDLAGIDPRRPAISPHHLAADLDPDRPDAGREGDV